LYVFTWVKKFFVKSCGGEVPPRPLPPVPSPAPPKKGGGGGRRGRRGEE